MEVENNEKYRLTPRAIFYSALKEAGYINNILDETYQMKLAWIYFVDHMRLSGYLEGSED